MIMKKILNLLVLVAFFMVAPLVLSAQTPPHPNGGNAPGSGSTPVGGGAPIGSGLVMLIAMGAAYGVKKVYHLRKEE